MYHDVVPDGREPGYFGVSRSTFAAHLDAIRQFGLKGVSLEQALASGHPNSVAVTFDDGYATHLEQAVPELLARGMTATFFVITSRIGTPGFLTWDELREMASLGMSIQSHTHSHPFLSELTHAEVLADLLRSRELLDRELRQETATLALPNGDHPRHWSSDDYARCGYRRIATSRWGANPVAPLGREVIYLRRYTVRNSTGPAAFERMVRARPARYSPEGMRLAVLSQVRRILGPTRYARWRRKVLRALRVEGPEQPIPV